MPKAKVEKPVKETIKAAPKKEVAKVAVKKSEATKKPTGILNAESFSLQGKNIGQEKLPEEIFGQKAKASLISQAVRVYQFNIAINTANTKTRGEVRGGGAKPWRQKGTGRARAGSNRSPLWVGGGITFGPRNKDVSLKLPQKMKHKALIYALSEKAKSGSIKVVSDIEKCEPKTKTITSLIKNMETKGSMLFVVSAKNENLKLATRNIQNIKVETAANLNAYEILKFKNIIFSKESLGAIK